MNTGFLYQAILLMVSLILVAAPALGQTVQKPLGDKENPLLIGNRDLNTDWINFYSLDQEIALGRQLAVDVDREVRLVNDPLVTEYVHRVGQNIVLHSDAGMPFTIKIIDSDDVNAFALPGGYLYVNRGMLEAADSEAELAWVMAHWIGHVAARHGLEQESKINLINYNFGWLFPQDGSDYVSPGCRLIIPLALLKFSCGAEEEADQLGAQYMWASGYDPQALGDFFEKLQLKEEAKPGTVTRLFSRRLMTGDRIGKVNRLVARFPDRLELEPNSFEFSVIKARLMASHAEKRPADLRWTPKFRLLVASAQGLSAGPEEIYASAAIDDQGQLRIVTKDGREILPKKEDEQVGFSSPRVSDDGRSVGWLAEFPSCCTSYPIPRKLMILTNGRMRAFTGSGLPIWRWAFRERGRRFAFEQEHLHFGSGIHYELRDVATGRLIDDYSPEYGPDLHLIPNQRNPRWVDELNALK